MKIRIFAVLLLLPMAAQAQIFKCVKQDGTVEFSTVACSSDVGVASDTGIKAGQVSADEVRRIEASRRMAEDARRNTAAVAQGQVDRPVKSKSGGVTVVRDSSRPLTTAEILRERMERRRLNAENGIVEPSPKNVRVNCNESGRYTHCFGSDGSRSTTVRTGSGKSSTTTISR